MSETTLNHPRFGSSSTCDDVVSGLDLSDRTMLVTGANSGIGFATARSIASAGAHVIVACRRKASAEETAGKIIAAHANANVTPLELDLASFASIRRAAQAVPAQKLNALICNAGLYTTTFQATEDGLEQCVGVSHFGHFLLTGLLMDKLRAAAPARVVMVSSESHRMPPTLNFERFPLRADNYRGLTAYGQAKLCNVLFANELTRRFKQHGVTANSLHPGSLIGTSIFRNSWSAKVLAAVVRPFTKTIDQGAATTVYCAVDPRVEGIGGLYYNDCKERRMSRGASDEQVAKRLWDLSVERVGNDVFA